MSEVSDLSAHIEHLFTQLHERFDLVDGRFDILEGLIKARPQSTPAGVESPLYTSVKEFMSTKPGIAFRPGAIARHNVGGGPQQIGAVLRKMEREGLVTVQEGIPDATGYVPRAYTWVGE